MPQSLDSSIFNTSVFFSLLKKRYHNLKSKSTLQWGELFYFITKRRSLYVVRKYKIDLFSLPMKRCCSNSQSELSQFTLLSPITFTWVWMSLAAEIWPFSAQGDKDVPWPAVPECPVFIYCIHAHLLKMRYSRANIFQNRCHIYNIYTFVHTYLYSCDVQKFKKNVHIYYKIVTKTGQCFAHSGKMKLS